MKVYIIRHGESTNNLKGLWTGWVDAELTQKGYDDAEKVREIIKGVKFDKVFSSDLNRAVKTAETALPNCKYQTSPLLREIHLGNLENTPIKSLTEKQKQIIEINGYKSFGGETFDEFRERILEFRKQLEKLDCESVAIFCHGGWLRYFLFEIIQTRLTSTAIQCNNCNVGIFEFKDQNWSLHSWINLI
ncbi:MAG: histidine phosphatase family protein [Clostridia bacterium]|nr:histidine phosphatase family protein [Clostridia bacterium]